MRRREPRIPAGSPLRHILEYSLLILGAAIIAASFNLFLNPNRIASGGVTGISTILQDVWGMEPAWIQWGLNIPLFFLGLWLLGGSFGVKTALGSFILPLFVFLGRTLPPLTENLLLASIYGGIGVGIGLGLVFRGQASTGGLDLAARIIHKYTGVSLGWSIAMLDGLVIVGAGVLFSPEKALYALIGLFVTGKTIDLVQLGLETSKVAFVISRRPDEVSRAVLYDLDRGLTRLSGQGGYTGDEQTVLLVVVGQREVTKLRALVKSADPHAFIIISSTAEVFGEGFKLHE